MVFIQSSIKRIHYLHVSVLVHDFGYVVAHSEPSQTSKIELFVEIVKAFQPLTIFAESSILDILLCLEYASEMM